MHIISKTDSKPLITDVSIFKNYNRLLLENLPYNIYISIPVFLTVDCGEWTFIIFLCCCIIYQRDRFFASLICRFPRPQ